MTANASPTDETLRMKTLGAETHQILLNLFAGTLFGIGLTVSDMVNPARVQAFLDIFGNWDPSLAFVMGGAIVPMAIAWLIQKQMRKPIAAAYFDLPGTRKLDVRLILGAVFFGVGWGLSGLCPGPAIADLYLAPSYALLFVAAMSAGIVLHHFTPSMTK